MNSLNSALNNVLIIPAKKLGLIIGQQADQLLTKKNPNQQIWVELEEIKPGLFFNQEYNDVKSILEFIEAELAKCSTTMECTQALTAVSLAIEHITNAKAISHAHTAHYLTEQDYAKLLAPENFGGDTKMAYQLLTNLIGNPDYVSKLKNLGRPIAYPDFGAFAAIMPDKSYCTGLEIILQEVAFLSALETAKSPKHEKNSALDKSISQQQSNYAQAKDAVYASLINLIAQHDEVLIVGGVNLGAMPRITHEEEVDKEQPKHPTAGAYAMLLEQLSTEGKGYLENSFKRYGLKPSANIKILNSDASANPHWQLNLAQAKPEQLLETMDRQFKLIAYEHLPLKTCIIGNFLNNTRLLLEDNGRLVVLGADIDTAIKTAMWEAIQRRIAVPLARLNLSLLANQLQISENLVRFLFTPLNKVEYAQHITVAVFKELFKRLEIEQPEFPGCELLIKEFSYGSDLHFYTVRK
jgi:hypothetical protein